MKKKSIITPDYRIALIGHMLKLNKKFESLERECFTFSKQYGKYVLNPKKAKRYNYQEKKIRNIYRAIRRILNKRKVKEII